MDKLFICESELAVFKTRHPEYNSFTEVKDNEGNLVGYDCEIVEENEKEN